MSGSNPCPKNTVKLDELGEYQILDLQQDKSMDSEFNDVLEKVTELASIAPLADDRVITMFDRICKTRNRMVAKRENFCDTLSKIVHDRDITLEKMKQASDLPIEIPKFTGYEAKLDFYTFR